MRKKRTIQGFRRMHGLTQKELAELLDCSQTCIANWEAGFRTPPLKRAKKVADLFGVRIDDIDFVCPEELHSDLKHGA